MSIFSFLFEGGDMSGMCALLNKHPERVNSVDSEGYTPLHRALMKHYNDMAAELITRGAVIPVQNEGGPIHWALDSEKTALINPIIHRELDINALDKNGITPLAKAAAKGYGSAVECLIAKHADVEAINDKGFTALLLALRNSHVEVARTLIRTGRALNAQDYRGRSALMVAIKDKLGDVVSDLLAQKADVNLADENGWRALHKAVADDALDYMKDLLDNGADIDARDENGWACIHLACWKGYEEAVGMLIARGCNCNIMTTDGNTPLMWALRGQSPRHRTIIDRLLAEGADVTLQNKEGSTALHKASQAGYAKVVVKLVEAGADVTLADNEGRSSLDVAKDDTIRHLLLSLQSKRDLLK